MKRLTSLFSLWLMTICVVCAQTVQEDLNTVKGPAVQYQEKISEVDAKSRELEASFKELSAHVSCLEYAVDMQKDIIAQEQSVIENGLSISNCLLGMFALLITLGGVFLGWYISKKENSMKGLLKNVTDKQEEIMALKTDIETTAKAMRDLDSEMQNNVDGLFKRLRRNDTISLLERLVKVPEDVRNILDLLLARDLESDDFDLLFSAYTTLLKTSNDNTIPEDDFSETKTGYFLLFFQHFFEKSIQIQPLMKEMIEFFPDALDCAFRLDIDRTLSSLIGILNDTSIEGGNDDVLAKYILALYRSKHKLYIEPYQLIIDNCNNSINLKAVWDILVAQGEIIEPFGNLLCEKYKEDTEFVDKVKERIATLRQDKKSGKSRKSQES